MPRLRALDAVFIYNKCANASGRSIQLSADSIVGNLYHA